MYPVITIGREYGSGGRTVGKKVAELLGIHYFDKELLSLAAKESGIDYHIAGSVDEKPNGSFLYSIVTAAHPRSMGFYDSNSLTINDRLFIAQKNVIERLAEAPCVIVGRCADEILKDKPENISVFIHAPLEFRMRRVARTYNISLEKAKEKIVKTDKSRASFYKYNSDRKWGAVENYSLCFDSSKLDLDKIAELIADYAKKYIAEKEQNG